MGKSRFSEEMIIAKVQLLRSRTGKCTIGALAREIDAPRATIQHRLETLIKQGLLARDPGVYGGLKLGNLAQRPGLDVHLRIVMNKRGDPVIVEVVPPEKQAG